MLMRRDMLDELGRFDEGYWLYMEDLDLCYRAAAAGWITWYEPSVTATHLKGGSSGSSRGLRANVAFHRGMARFYRLHYARSRSRGMNAAVSAAIWAKLLVVRDPQRSRPARARPGAKLGSAAAPAATTKAGARAPAFPSRPRVRRRRP